MSDELLKLSFGALAPRTIDRLIRIHGSADAVTSAVERGRTDISPHAVRAIAVPADQRRAQLLALGVEWLPRDADGYPERLRRFENAPRWLFVRGRIGSAPAIGIVGTRRCTAYGTELAADYGSTASRAGWTVVSGLAKGIDHAAHQGSVTSGGRAVAVLGSGIDVVYPRRHVDLHDAIVAGGGAICSEFPPGTRPDAWRFPTRNRIIAGLSDVVLVVEAGETGGALITARIALEYGIPIFATPGDIDRAASIGTNHLIRDGAFPVLDGDDLEQILDFVVPMVTEDG